MIPRELRSQIEKRIGDKKAIILPGPRQVGKTTLIQQIFSDHKTLWLNGDDADVRSMLSQMNATKMKDILGNHSRVVIDEAQRIENIGLCIKIMTDQIQHVQVVATGSSSLVLANRINEPLTGRKWEYYLYPISFGEMVAEHGLFQEKRNLEKRLIYGYYPDVINRPGEEALILKLLADSYLYKDILVWERILKPEKQEVLIKALAFQAGNDVSYNELAQVCSMDKETVEKYVQLLEKAFIVFRVNSFSRNLRNELKKSRKIYFYDNGIRNAVISQFSPLSSRADVGGLWENFLVSERQKFLHYPQIFCSRYFWRTTAQQEVDYLEERNGELSAWEFKWNPKQTHRLPKTFENHYKPLVSGCITPENVENFLLPVNEGVGYST